MRFVLKDNGCVLCRQEGKEVFFTRFMGDYTARLSAEQFPELQARATRRELYHLSDINGYFDDQRHFDEIRGLCGFTHPVLEAAGNKAPPQFNNFNTLRKHIETVNQQFFCDVCLKGRKVFVSEQILYSKDGLRRHQEAGDASGPLAESGFKGHPLCKFCRTRFFDSNELYRHMESGHEHCFLCRRATPDKYVYFRHYRELEDHFQKDHHLCPHPSCLEKKFVVFNSDFELKAHFASEHGDEVKMSNAQRRQAFTLPVQFQYRTHDDEDTEPGPSARMDRAAVVIGGGYNLPTGRRGRTPQRGGYGGSSMHHSRSQPQIAAEAEASEAAQQQVSSVAFTVDDFPVVAGSAQQASGPMGRWAAFAGAQGNPTGLNEQDFPALPSLSRNQKRRIKEQQRTLADRLLSAAQPPRVINRASGAASSSSAAVSGPSAYELAPTAAEFPALPSSQPGPSAAAAGRPPAPVPAPASAPGPSTSASVGSSSSAFTLVPGLRSAVDIAAPAAASKRPPTLGDEEFPSLGGWAAAGGASSTSTRKGKHGKGAATAAGAGASAAAAQGPAYAGVASGADSAPVPPVTASSTSAAILNSLFRRPGSAAGTAGASQATTSPEPAEPDPLQPEEFPSLAPAPRPAKAPGGKAAGRPVTKAAVQEPAPKALPPPGSVSEALKAANRKLIDSIKRRLSDDQFASFRQQSGAFMRGDLLADEYHDYMVGLGLLPLAAELASLCPDADKRALLMAVHSSFIASPAAQDPAKVGAGWMPPEAASAKAAKVAHHAAWTCTHCGVINAPDDTKCEACSWGKPKEDVEASAPLTASSGRPAAPSMAALAAAPMSAPASNGRSGSAPAAPSPPTPLAGLLSDDFPSLAPGPGSRPAPAPAATARAPQEAEDEGAGLAMASPGKGKKGKGKQTIKIGLPAPTASPSSSKPKASPQNVWTQPQFLAKQQEKVGNQWAGGGAGKVAKMHGAVNDAWSK